MANEGFSVDTHLFRELGELLVGRDSTALVELIKNAYDADATEVIVHGTHLGDADKGSIIIADNGIGMTPEQFRSGFLRIASRLKEQGDRRSPKYERRYTGAKGIGRLAAHKLARRLRVNSIPNAMIAGANTRAVDARIDWDQVERYPTLDELSTSGAVQLIEEARPHGAKAGTRIELRGLRRRWTATERGRFFAEVQTFKPPTTLITLPRGVISRQLLFTSPVIADASVRDPGCDIRLTGDLESGESYWPALAQAAQWVIEIDSDATKGTVRYAVAPTRAGREQFPQAQASALSMDHPDPKVGPRFQARILIREGGAGSGEEKAWMGRTSGIRVFMEGFRVLPYGELNDDWLSIDADYTRRQKSLAYLPETQFGHPDEEEGLVALRNRSYFGAVFLTLDGSPSMRMLVNREGFIPDAGYDNLVKIVRTGVDLSVRVRAAAKAASRDARTEVRKQGVIEEAMAATDKLDLRQAVEVTVVRARDLAREARERAAAGDIRGAQESITKAAAVFEAGSRTSERFMTEPAMLRILASVGTQMAAFVHEINGLLGSAIAVEQTIQRISEDQDLPRMFRRRIAELQQAIGDLRRSVERQASYLTDVISPDARRRRSRQKLADRFDAGRRIVEFEAARRQIEIINEIPADLKSPPMFPAELTLVFSNLLTNAVKAAGKGGRIRATAKKDGESIVLRLENTGVAVDPDDGERWFRPFESTTVQTDPVLGQGMGMGLPITRNILEQYGSTIAFVRPNRGYVTALEISFRG